MNEKLGIAESTVLESMLQFCGAFNFCFRNESLREQMEADMTWILQKSEACDFSDMTGSSDCFTWELRPCPTA